jgi:peptidoglycan/LPS O-acetylase OafA/YrhL
MCQSLSSRPQPLLRAVMPELDSLRGIAILGVILLHGFYWQYSGLRFTGVARFFLRVTQPGWLGVNLFFVLSGFLITGILIDSRDSPQYYRRFYIHRALRILPAYYSLLILLALFRRVTAAYFGLSVLYLSNVTGFFGVMEEYGPLWSLAVEEHFYLLWPLLVRCLTSRRLTLLAFAICVTVPTLRALAFYTGHTIGLASYTWFVADGLASGGLLAILLRTSITRPQVSRVCVALLVGGGLMAIAGAPFGILSRNRLLGAALQHTIIDFAFSGVLLSSLLLGTSRRQHLTNISILRFFGYISYGLYLIHLQVFRTYDKLCRRFWPSLLPTDGRFGLVLFRFLVAGGSAIIFAYLSRSYYEEMFLRLKQRLDPKESTARVPVHSGLGETAAPTSETSDG